MAHWALSDGLQVDGLEEARLYQSSLAQLLWIINKPQTIFRLQRMSRIFKNTAKCSFRAPCGPRRRHFLMFLTSNLESTGQKPFCTGVLSTQRSCARCKAGAASQRRADFSAGMSFASMKHSEDIVNWIHHSLHIFHSIVIKISLLVSENPDGVSQTLKNGNQ